MMNITEESQVYHSRDDHFLRKPYLSTVAFAIGILLFLLPFAEFKCGSVAMLGNTGMGIAMGRPWKVAEGFGKNEITEKINSAAKEQKDLMKEGPNIFAIISLVAVVFGLAISFTKVKWRSVAGMCAGILAAVMLLALMIQFKIQVRALMREGRKDESGGMDLQGIIRMEFTFWYYLSLISFIVAAFLNYLLDKLALREAINRSMDFEFQKTYEYSPKAKV